MNRIAPRSITFAFVLLTTATLAMAKSAPDTITLHQGAQIVKVSSVEPDSIVGQYRIDFAKLDRNHDGYISRAQAKADPTLSAEFDAVDLHHHNRLNKTKRLPHASAPSHHAATAALVRLRRQVGGPAASRTLRRLAYAHRWANTDHNLQKSSANQHCMLRGTGLYAARPSTCGPAA